MLIYFCLFKLAKFYYLLHDFCVEAVTFCRSKGIFDILAYSGYAKERLLADFSEIAGMLDVLISDPFQQDAGTTRLWRGSDNQRVTLLSELARSRYGADVDQQTWNGARRLDVMLDDAEVWMAGIPASGDWARLKEKLAERGYEFEASDGKPEEGAGAT